MQVRGSCLRRGRRQRCFRRFDLVKDIALDDEIVISARELHRTAVRDRDMGRGGNDDRTSRH